MSRVIVHPKIKDEYMTKLVAKTQKLKIGAGDEEGTEVTPLISTDQMQRAVSYTHLTLPTNREV